MRNDLATDLSGFVLFAVGRRRNDRELMEEGLARLEQSGISVSVAEGPHRRKRRAKGGTRRPKRDGGDFLLHSAANVPATSIDSPSRLR